MTKNFTPIVNIDNVYQYNAHRDILTKQEWIGTYNLNSTVEASAMPRKRVVTNELISDESAATVTGLEKGADRALDKAISAAKHVAPTAKVVGAINDTNSIVQHAIQGNGAEMVTEATGAIGQGSGAWLGAETGAYFGSLTGPAAPVATPTFAAFGAIGGALVGSDQMKKWGKQLTGGDTPDLMIPPKSPPNNADIKPTITTKEGDNYALVKVEGKYNWYVMLDNKDLMVENRFMGVMSGAKNAELTQTYLKAAGYDKQVQERINQISAQVEASKSQTNREIFTHNEITQRNETEAKITYIKQGKAPDGSELGKVKHEGTGTSIWIHDTQHKRFTSVGTTGSGKDSQSAEMYYDEKTGAHSGGKIYTPDGKGQHKITNFNVETLPDGTAQYKSKENEQINTRKVSQHVENIQMAHAFANELPINAVQSHSKLADAYVAQAAFIKQIESSGASTDLKSTALNHFNDKATNNIANGNIPTTQIITPYANQAQAIESKIG